MRSLAGPTEGAGGRVDIAARMTREANPQADDDNGGSQAKPVASARGATESVMASTRHVVVEATETTLRRSRTSSAEASGKTGESAQLSSMLESMADAPACDVCGTITVRNGTCYKCLNCGNSMGCS